MGVFKTPCRFPGCPNLAERHFCTLHQAGVPHQCASPKCPTLAPYGKRYCPEHEEQAQKEYDKQRGSARQRGYDKAWEKARSSYLATHPLCEDCDKRGLVEPAVMVHHIKPLSEGGKRLDPDNMQALCNRCHERQHGRGFRR